MDQVSILKNPQSNKYPPLDMNKIDEKYKCPECANLIQNAHQMDDCGCQYCLDCLVKVTSTCQNCIKCGQKITSSAKLPDRYLQNKILKLDVNCFLIDCSWSGTIKDYVQHYKSHFEDDKKCRNCLKTFESKSILDIHLDLKNGDCPKQLIECEFKKFGCLDSGPFLREQYPDHLSTYIHSHIRQAIEYFNNKIIYLNDSNKNLKSTSSESSDIKYQDSGVVGSFNQTNQKVESTVEMLQNTQNGLINEINRIVRSNDKLKQENVSLKQTLADYKLTTQDLHKTLALTQVSLLTLEERLISLEKVSYDGSLLWKITNVHERMQEAKSGRQISFYSPPFYTNRNGYKMCARVYLNGDGNGRNTHLSLFFVILRGENDALLRWPFRQKVTFILIDQSSSESRENVIDAFRPDPNSSSFRRPASDMNIASGLPVFCPLGKLMSSDHEYIKDNTMFIKIMVDIKDLNDI